MALDVHDWLALDFVERTSQRETSVARAREITASHHAFISVADSPEASSADGELAGVPFAVKDNIDVAGLETTCGGPLLGGAPAEVDADLVSLLREAGAVVVGKANLHELAFGATSNNATYGPVRNPFDEAHVAGGSSGGSAVAVALGSVPFSLGSDTGGSVTVPSAFCGIVGFRPTTGRYPGTGVVNLSTSRDTIGLHTRTVRDARHLDGVIARSTAGSTPPALTDLVLARVVSRFEGVEDEVAALIEVALDRLQSRGVKVVDVEIPGDIELAAGPGIELVFFETQRLVPARVAGGLEKHPAFGDLVEQMASPDVKAIAQGIADADVSAEAYEAARRQRWQLRRAYEQAFAASGAHALLGPTAPVLPPRIGDDETISVNGEELPTFSTLIRNAGPGTVAGVPMLSVPAGFSATGLPVGLCLEGRSFGDDELLAIGETVEGILVPQQ